MKTKIDKQKVLEKSIDVVVIAAIVTFLWNLIVPTLAGLPVISFWIAFSLVATIYIVRYLYKAEVIHTAKDPKMMPEGSLVKANEYGNEK